MDDDPDEEEATPGGWSMDGQPQDAMHNVFHVRKDAHERVSVSWHNNIFLRQKLTSMSLGCDEYLRPQKVSNEDLLIGDVWAWEGLPRKISRWAWRSRGFVTLEEQAEMQEDPEILKDDDENIKGLVKDLLRLEAIPDVLEKACPWYFRAH